MRGEEVKVTFSRSGQPNRFLHCGSAARGHWQAPVMDGIDPAKTGLATEGRFVKVNSNCTTSLPGVYAIGDLVGGVMLAHKASAEAEVAMASILGHPKAIKPEWIPRCIWGIDEIAQSV